MLGRIQRIYSSKSSHTRQRESGRVIAACGGGEGTIDGVDCESVGRETKNRLGARLYAVCSSNPNALGGECNGRW